MKFARLLLESYSRLHEANEGLMWLTGQPMPAPGQELPLSHPTGQGVKDPTIILYTDDQNIVRAKGGPFGSFPVQVNAIPQDPELKSKINNWYAGTEEEGGDETTQQTGVPEVDPYEMDPVFSQLNEDDRDRLKRLDAILPETSKTLKSIFENAKDSVTEISERKLLQKVLGGASRGSLAYNLEKELSKGREAVKFERSDFIGFALDPDLKLTALQGSLETMEQFSKAFKNASTCEQSVDNMTDVADKVRISESGSIFFKNSYEANGFGISLSIAKENPLNIMASQYNDKLDACYKEGASEWHIPVKEIKANATGDGGNVSNMIKEVSEKVQVAAFHFAKGNVSKAKEMIMDIYSEFGEEAFRRLELRKDIDAGENILDEEYQQMIDELEAFGISAADDVKNFAKAYLKSYLLESATFAKNIGADYAVRVGGTAGKGDKSDVDYVMKQKPINLPEGTVMHKVKFENLAPEVQKEIGTPTQEHYFLIKDSLKTYGNEGEVKVGTAYSIETEAGRLLDDGDKHGSYVWDALGVDDNTKAAGKEVLTKMQRTSSNLKKLLDKDFQTGSMSVGNVKTFLSKQIEEMARQAGADKETIRAMKKVLSDYQKGGDNKAVLGMLDREFMMLNLKNSLEYNDDGTVNKRKSQGGLAAIAALQASMGVDSTGIKPQSTIHILGTGNTYRHDQNDSIVNPLLELLDPESQRNVTLGSSKITIDQDGSFEMKAGKGRASGNGYVNTNYLKKN